MVWPSNAERIKKSKQKPRLHQLQIPTYVSVVAENNRKRLLSLLSSGFGRQKTFACKHYNRYVARTQQYKFAPTPASGSEWMETNVIKLFFMFYATDWPTSPRDSRYPIRCRTDSPPICRPNCDLFFSSWLYNYLLLVSRDLSSEQQQNEEQFTIFSHIVLCALSISAFNQVMVLTSQMKWNLWIELINYI